MKPETICVTSVSFKHLHNTHTKNSYPVSTYVILQASVLRDNKKKNCQMIDDCLIIANAFFLKMTHNLKNHFWEIDLKLSIVDWIPNCEENSL